MEIIEHVRLLQINMNHCKEVYNNVDEYMKASKADIAMLQEPYIQSDNMKALYIEENVIYKKQQYRVRRRGQQCILMAI